MSYGQCLLHTLLKVRIRTQHRAMFGIGLHYDVRACNIELRTQRCIQKLVTVSTRRQEECSTQVASILISFTKFFGWKTIPRALSVNLTKLSANNCESEVRNSATLFGCLAVREARIKADKMGPCTF